MNVLLHPLGSHGDVHPFIGIGRALKDRGHRVTLITSAPFRDLADRNGFDFAPVGTDADYHAFTHNPDLWRPWRSFRVIFDRDRFPRFLRQAYRHIAERYVPGDTVLVGGSLGLAARIAHEALGVPCVTAHLQPMVLLSIADPPDSAVMTPPRWWPHWLRRLARWAGERLVLDGLTARPVNALRRELGLPPVTRVWRVWRESPQLMLGLFPDWFASAPDWPPQLRTVGFVRYDQGETKELPAAVREFLDAGPPPVVVTFGSAMRQGRPYFEAAAGACRSLGVRGLLLGQGSDQIPRELPPGVVHADYAPFSLVFPRAAAVVHHGGIGTTAQALTAGVPQLVMPLAFDQPDNARRLERLGVARSLAPKRFTGPRVAALLGELTTSAAVAAACKAAAAKLAAADPLDEVCRLVEGLNGSDRAAGETPS
ncbi:MAG TPA: glycosyltransferase [Fimbriiglobus sp.]|nr:glycosyltransferase [Fimbriiglobus sp.]